MEREELLLQFREEKKQMIEKMLDEWKPENDKKKKR